MRANAMQALTVLHCCISARRSGTSMLWSRRRNGVRAVSQSSQRRFEDAVLISSPSVPVALAVAIATSRRASRSEMASWGRRRSIASVFLPSWATAASRIGATVQSRGRVVAEAVEGREPVARARNAHRPRDVDARCGVEPLVLVGRPEYHRHAVVNRFHECVRRRREDRIRLNQLVTVVPAIVEARQCYEVAIGARNAVLLLFLLALDRLPLKERGRWHKAALALERSAEHWLRVRLLGACVERRADRLRVLRPEWDDSPFAHRRDPLALAK